MKVEPSMAGAPPSRPVGPLLERIPLFARLDAAQIARLSRQFITARFRAGERVIMQGDPVQRFIVVHRGELSLLRSSADGRERIVAMLRPGMHFGLAEMITGEGSAVAVRAEQECILGVLSQEAFRREVLADTKLSYALMQTMARSIFRLVRELDHATFESVPQRLARYLLAAAHHSGLRTDRGIQILRAPTHQELANLVGATRETVTRALGKMRDQGLLELGYRRITILDHERLAASVSEE
ncbi:MAG: Crp/Fnr family transcriptional regulator [Planctomycetes bacterium]|nr:Crp/Fnr family transcriptional regulator [Planctomycetota bacterium]